MKDWNPFFRTGNRSLLKRTPKQHDFYHLMNGKRRGPVMKGWTNDDRVMIACCNDGTRPVIFKTERIDIPENDEEPDLLAGQNFTDTAGKFYTGGNRTHAGR